MEQALTDVVDECLDAWKKAMKDKKTECSNDTNCPVTLSAFIREWAINVGMCPEQRCGQFLMNLLHSIRMDLYTAITGTDSDPFYDDNKLAACFEWLGEHWND